MKKQENDIDLELIGKFLDGSATSREKSRIDRWLENSEENREEFRRIKSIWSAPHIQVPEVGIRVNTDTAWEKLSARINKADIENERTGSEGSTRSLTYYLLRVAAVIVFAAGIFALYKNYLERPEQISIAAENRVLESALPDESTVTLNENSLLTFPEKFAGNKRIVELEGEAFFEVTRNAKKPFVVRVPEAEIEVIGTSFNVRALESEPEVTVTVQDGKVRLSDREDIAFVVLEKNEKGIFNRETGHIEKYVSTDESELFWKTRTLIFRDTRLSKVFETLEKLYHVKIHVLDEKLKECLLSAKFQDQDIDEILSNIAINFDLEVIKKNGSFEISGDGC